jgi:hypothetical protein
MDPSFSFFSSLKEIPFQEMPSNLRELALETYIKETMGMASSLQSLEAQLRTNQAVAGSVGGPIGQQSLALIAAVSQLRSDAWGLSQLRLSQYSAMARMEHTHAEEPEYHWSAFRAAPVPASAGKQDKVATS